MNTDDKLLRGVYTMLKEDADSNITYNGLNWAHHIKDI